MILFVWGSIAYLFQKREETRELSNMRKEVLREKQYREVVKLRCDIALLQAMKQSPLNCLVHACHRWAP